jgi:hypothetical protein
MIAPLVLAAMRVRRCIAAESIFLWVWEAVNRVCGETFVGGEPNWRSDFWSHTIRAF